MSGFINYLHAFTKLPEKKEGVTESADLSKRRQLIEASFDTIVAATPTTAVIPAPKGQKPKVDDDKKKDNSSLAQNAAPKATISEPPKLASDLASASAPPKKISADTKEKTTPEKKGAGLTGQLGRIFNEYPLKFVDDMKQEHIAIPIELFNDWANRIFEIITKGEFETELIDKENAVDPNKIPPEDFIIYFRFALSEKLKAELNAIFQEIILYACKEILNERGQLKQDFIDIYQLQNLLKTSPQFLAIITQLVYSYFSQIAFSNLSLELDKRIREQFTNDSTQIVFGDMKASVIRKHSDNVIFNVELAKLTSFIPDIVQTFLNQILVEDLAQLSMPDLKAILEADIHTSKDLSNKIDDFPFQQNKGFFLHKKIEFWIDVMDAFRTRYQTSKNEDDFSRMQFFYQVLQPLILTSKVALTSAQTEKVVKCMTQTATPSFSDKKSDEVITELDEQKKDAIKKPKEFSETLIPFLNSVNNSFIVNHLMFAIKAHNPKIKEKDMKLLLEIQKLNNDRDAMQSDPQKLLGIIVNLTELQGGKKIKKFIAQYRTGLFGKSAATAPIESETPKQQSLFSKFWKKFS